MDRSKRNVWILRLSLALNLSACITMLFLMPSKCLHGSYPSCSVESFPLETETRMSLVPYVETVAEETVSAERVHSAGRKCDLCPDNWLFILGAGGRTGSTTAQKMFGSVPGFEISGEHFGILNEEEKIWRVLKRRSLKHMVSGPNTHRQYDIDDFRCSVQHRMKEIVLGKDYERLGNKTSVLGFKEIMYTDLRSLSFISRMFPCARYVFTYRNRTADTGALSRLPPAFTGRGMPQVWSESASTFRRVHEMLPSTTSMLELESFSLQSFNSILHDMLHVGGCSFERLLHNNKGGTYNPEKGENLGLVKGSCDLGGVDFRLSSEQITDNMRKWEMLMSEHDQYGAGERPRYADLHGTARLLKPRKSTKRQLGQIQMDLRYGEDSRKSPPPRIVNFILFDRRDTLNSVNCKLSPFQSI